jgi:hypothetical protein
MAASIMAADETSSLAAAVTTVATSSEPAPSEPHEEMSTALPLVTYDHGVFELGTEAAAVLKSLKEQQVAVVSIAGNLRQGKSYILNRLSQAVGGFKVAPNVDPCTHGIWMWPKPVELDGQEHKVVSRLQTLPQRSDLPIL